MPRSLIWIRDRVSRPRTIPNRIFAASVFTSGIVAVCISAVCAFTPLAASATPGSDPQSAAAADSTLNWGASIERAAAAVAIGDNHAATEIISRLRTEAPGNPTPRYLEGRLHDNGARWQDALAEYQAIIVDPQIDLGGKWIDLVSGRLVRAERAWESQWAGETASQPARAQEHDRCLVVPPALLILSPQETETRDELEALSAAIGAWLIAALRQSDIARPVGSHATALLLSVARGGTTVRIGAEGMTAPGTAAPVTTTLGITARLTQLVPAGPAPWDSSGVTPARYLSGPPAAQWSLEVEQALMHFQREHGLAPTGIPDAETRQALERAYRDAQSRVRIALPREAQVDPTIAAARLAGASAVWTATLEPQPTGDIAWNAAWLMTQDGSVFGEPLRGVLAKDHFEDAWTLLVRESLRGSPFSAGSPALEEIVPPPAPRRSGAVEFGRALLALEAGDIDAAADFFERAAQRGAGEGARWYARAWKRDERELDALEDELLDLEIFGPARVRPGWIDSFGNSLAYPLWRCRGTALAVITREAALGSLTESGWIRISGQVEEP